MPDNNISATQIFKHQWGNFAGKGARFLRGHILGAEADLAADQQLVQGGQGDERRADQLLNTGNAA